MTTKGEPDYQAANEIADRLFTLIAEDGRLTPRMNPNELLTIATQLIIGVMKAIDDPGRRVACDLLANRIRDLPEAPIWEDTAPVVFH
jgi:hypothetical protein